MAAQYPPKKNDTAGYTFYVSLVSQADTKIFQVNPTLAACDVKIAIDDGAPANLGTLPAVDADFTKRVKVVLSQAETNGDNVTLIFTDAAGAEWCDLTINLQTVPDRQRGDSFALIGATGSGLTTLATQASVNTIDDFLDTEVAAILAAVDTEVAAIKAITDQITFGTANRVNAQVFGIESGAVTATAIATDAIGAAELAAGAANKIADHVLRRSAATARASADGDAASGRSLLGAVAKLVNKISTAVTPGKITVYQEDDSTTAFTQTITTDVAAEPITVADTD